MNIKPVAGPSLTAPTGAQSSQSDARSRAIQMLSGSAPAVDQNAISPEERQAVQAPVSQDVSTEVETKAAEETAPKVEEKAEETPYSSQIALLARKERALRARQQQADTQLKAREEALAKREAELTGRNPSFNPDEYIPKADLKTKALDVLLANGVDANAIYEQLTTVQNVDPRVSAKIQALEAQIERMAKANEQASKQQEEAQSAQYQAAIKQIERDVNTLVSSDEQFEMIKATKASKDVVELIEKTFKEDGYVMSVEDAATEVENYLIEQAERLARTNKIQARLKPKASEVPPQAKADMQQPSADKQQQQAKTLTNAISSTRQLSAKERAILAFKGELK